MDAGVSTAHQSTAHSLALLSLVVQNIFSYCFAKSGCPSTFNSRCCYFSALSAFVAWDISFVKTTFPMFCSLRYLNLFLIFRQY